MRRCSSVIVKMACERDERLFMPVAAVARSSEPWKPSQLAVSKVCGTFLRSSSQPPGMGSVCRCSGVRVRVASQHDNPSVMPYTAAARSSEPWVSGDQALV